MAGGLGSRFWPLTKDNNPKQFLDLLGRGETMLQSTFRRYAQVCPAENIFVVTGESMVERVKKQIPELGDHQVLCEPLRRNTAPCVAYAASIIGKINPNANIVVSPSDHAIFNEELFAANLDNALAVAERHDWIVTMGAMPTNPNTKYGYIQFAQAAACRESADLHKVVTFTEKPPLEMAAQFIASGEFLWNAGIFVWRMPVLKEAYRKHLPNIYEHFFDIDIDTPQTTLEQIYATTEQISIDFGIMEKADNVYVMKAAFGWSDVETWDSLYTNVAPDNSGNAVASGKVLSYDSHNCVFHIPDGKAAIVQGLDNYIVAANGDTVLVCPRNCEDLIVKYGSDYELSKVSR